MGLFWSKPPVLYPPILAPPEDTRFIFVSEIKYFLSFEFYVKSPFLNNVPLAESIGCSLKVEATFALIEAPDSPTAAPNESNKQSPGLDRTGISFPLASIKE